MIPIADLPARPRARTIASFPLLLLLVGAYVTEAQAQVQEGDPVELQDRNQAQAVDRDHIVVGIGASVAPAYPGSERTRVLPLPAIDIKQGRFYANLRNGIGLDLIESGTLTIGGGVTYVPGYRRRDVPEGIHHLKLGAGFRGYASFRQAGFVATVGATRGFTGGSTKGVLVDASIAYPIRLSSRWTLTPSVATAWADRRYGNDFYGVDTGEALASGLPLYRAKSGIRDVTASLTAIRRLTDRVTLSATGGVTTLVGDVKNSPLVFRTTQPIGFLAIGYRF